MAPLDGHGLPKHQALIALAKAVGDRYRAAGDSHFTIAAVPTRDNLIAVTAYFPEQPEGQRRMSVLIPVTLAGWNVYIEQQLVHEFITVCQKRIELEKFVEIYLDKRTKEAANAYR